MTAAVGGILGAAVGAGVAIYFMKAAGNNAIWIALACGGLGSLFGLVFKIGF